MRIVGQISFAASVSLSQVLRYFCFFSSKFRPSTYASFICSSSLLYGRNLIQKKLCEMGFDLESLSEAASGAVGALVSTTILYPLDTCKSKYQAEVRAHHQQKYK